MNKIIKFTFLIAAVLVAFSVSALAQKRTMPKNTTQQTATTETGERVILREDGTWIYEEKSSEEQVFESEGMSFKLIDCRKNLQARKIICNFDVTNLNKTKTGANIYKNSTVYIDSTGNKITANNIQIANRSDADILPNRTVKMTIGFDLADPKSNWIAKLTIARSNNMGNVNQFLEFNDIALIK